MIRVIVISSIKAGFGPEDYNRRALIEIAGQITGDFENSVSVEVVNDDDQAQFTREFFNVLKYSRDQIIAVFERTAQDAIKATWRVFSQKTILPLNQIISVSTNEAELISGWWLLDRPFYWGKMRPV